MAKKSMSEKRAEREQAENQVLRRVFNVFLLGLAAEVYLFVVWVLRNGFTQSGLNFIASKCWDVRHRTIPSLNSDLNTLISR